ncbi:uncharacterized protein [Clytia hemisphaerica]|uniref:LicD/FKTN/FKRP nucleotidyltransferase domain-containing protein n=1 Tax=Clytia hemisphaerica TaxID=252671 RepID=A0A7M5V6S0_9CNID
MYRLVLNCWRKNKPLFLCGLFSVAFFIFYTLNVQGWHWYKMAKQEVCETPDNYMNELKSLFRDAHIILTKFGLTHVLIYGSLFGAMRFGGPLPWDNDFDLAILSEEVAQIDESKFLQEFYDRGIKVMYRHWKGEYVISRNKAHGDLMIFSETWFGDRGRTGIEPWVFFIHFRNFHQAPARLFEKPLPKLPFLGMNISVPREGMEIQRHFYPNDWWKEVKPKGC